MLHGSEGNVAWGDATIMKNQTRMNLVGQEEGGSCSSGTPGQGLGSEQHHTGTPCMHCTKTKLSVGDGEQVKVIARHLCAPAFVLSLSPRYLCAAMGPGNRCPALQEPLKILHLILLIFMAPPEGTTSISLELVQLCAGLYGCNENPLLLEYEAVFSFLWQLLSLPAVCRELLSESYTLLDKIPMFSFFGNRETKKIWVCTNIPLVLRGHSAVLPGAGNVYSPGVNESRQKQWRNRLCKPGGLSMHNSSISSAAKSI